MSELLVKQRPTLDLDDFERRLRQASAASHNDDPLVELARLVSEPYDPFGDVFAHEARSSHPHNGGDAADGHAAGDPDAHFGHYGAAALPPGDPAFDLPPHDGSGAGRPLFGDFAAIEAGLRGSLAHGEPSGSSGSHAYPTHAGAPDGSGFEPEWAEHRMQPPARGLRRPIYVMAATIAVGVIGIGVAFALKGHVATSPGEVKTILADAGPTKIQPPPDTSADGGSGDVNAFGKGSQTAPTKVVNREEQPVDIAQAVQDNAARAAPPAAIGATDASTVPVPPSPAQMQTAFADTQAAPGSRPDPIGQQVQSFGLAGLPQPKRVHVVSVRPDGSILPNDQPPAAALSAPHAAPAKPTDHVAPVAKASTPKAAPTKTSARVTTTPKTIEAIASADDAAPAAAAPVTTKPPKKPKPQKVASAETVPTDAGGDAPMAIAPASDGGGGFAVQLAAPGSEADAKSTSSRLAAKYADALGGRHLGFHKAESNGRSVYRVRVGSLSKADATSLCDKLKADGGTCFVAKN